MFKKKEKNKFTRLDYLNQCDEVILSIIVLHSLDYSELIKLDSPLFPINFEVWSETMEAESYISYNNFTDAIPKDIALEIGVYLKSILSFSSDKWTHTEFESNPFWEKSRIKAREFVSKLNLEGRGYWY